MVVKYTANATSSRRKPVHTIFVGRIVHSKTLKHLEILPKAALGVTSDGDIAFVDEHGHGHSDAQLRDSHAADGFRDADVVHLKRSQFLFPGMVDTHLHAPQWPNLALGMEGNLREWVEDWTDPVEVSLGTHELFTVCSSDQGLVQ